VDPLLTDACKLRLKRADEHLATLDTTRSTFLDEVHRRIVIDLDPEEPKPGDEVCATARVAQPPPLDIGVIVGEFGHNLRSILDYIVCDLVDHRGNTVTNQTAFVIADSESTWDNRCPNNLRGLNSEDIETIKAVQPYIRCNPATEDPLSRLGWLSNRDKHRLFHACYVSRPEPTKIPQHWPPGIVSPNRSIRFDRRTLGTDSRSDRAEIETACGILAEPNPQVDLDGDPPLDISLTDSERPLFLDDLRVIRVEVETIANALLARF
jgi:hypothetical protein